MPRPRPSRPPEIEQLVREFTAKLEDAIRREVAEQIRAHAERLRTTEREARPSAAPRMCPVPGCGKPAAGPRYRWRCREHKDVTVAAAVAADTVQVHRLPPGPAPGERRRASPPMDCRFPGCTVRSRGPKYNFFCGEHFRTLSYDDQHRYAQQWKDQRAQSRVARGPVEPGGPIIRRQGQEVRAEPPPTAGGSTPVLPENEG